MSNGFTRRTAITGALGAGFLAASPALVRRASAQSRELNIWTYAGYLTDDFRNRFEDSTGIRLNVRPVSDQGEQFNLMVAESGKHSADIVCCAGHRFYQFIEADLLQPIDLARLKGWGNISDAYAEANWVSRNGKVWGVPLAVVSTGLLYNTDAGPEPESWGVMFDPANAGRTSYQIQDFFQIVMNYLGYDGSAASYIGKPEEAQKAVNAARDFLIEHKDKVRRYYEAATEIQQMFLNGDVQYAQSGSGPAQQLIREGFPAGYTIPKEGGLAYAYGYNISKGAANVDNAYAFLDALLASPENGVEITRSTGYISTLKGAEELLNPQERRIFSLTEEQQQRLHWVNVETAAFIFDLIDKAAEEIRAA